MVHSSIYITHEFLYILKHIICQLSNSSLYLISHLRNALIAISIVKYGANLCGHHEQQQLKKKLKCLIYETDKKYCFKISFSPIYQNFNIFLDQLIILIK